MDAELLKLIIEIVVTIVAFLVGRYILPKVKSNIQDLSAQFEVLLKYAESSVAYARQFLDCPGKEKMDAVVEKLKVICEKYGIEVDEETLRGIGQKAYDAMIAGEKSSAVILEDALQELKTFTPVEAITEDTIEEQPTEGQDTDSEIATSEEE